MKIKPIILISIILTSPVYAVQLSAQVATNNCSAVEAISPNCSTQTASPLENLVKRVNLTLLNPGAVSIEINDYNYSKTKLKDAYNLRAGSIVAKGCDYRTDLGMIYKESFKWQKDNPKVKDLTPDKVIKHALFQTIFNSDRCTNEQVNPNWDNASTNYNGAQDAKINSAFSIRYTKGAHTKTSSVILVDKVEPFIYYK